MSERLPDIQRAARYLFLQKCSFGGHTNRRNFGTATTRPRFNLLTLEEQLSDAWRRLASAYIECKDFRDILPRYDRSHTCFFLDPPYWQIKEYQHNFVEQDFLDLAAALERLQGKFLMTINDTPDVRRIFRSFQILEVTLKYSCCSGKTARAKPRTELLIANYPI